MTSDGPVKKMCPKCKQVDVTTFSSCRNCGCKYDYKGPEKVPETSFNLIPVAVIAGLVILVVCVYQVLQVNHLYKRPDQLIGKTVACKGSLLVAASDKSSLLNLPEGDFKGLNHFGTDDGDHSQAGALNQLAAISSDVSLFEKYEHDSRFAMITKEPSAPPFSVKIIGATAPGDKYPLAQVEFLNGPKTGSDWWIASSRLDLSEKDR